jgi:hypothetical protein
LRFDSQLNLTGEQPMAPASRSFATALGGARFASDLLQSGYITNWDTTAFWRGSRVIHWSSKRLVARDVTAGDWSRSVSFSGREGARRSSLGLIERSNGRRSTSALTIAAHDEGRAGVATLCLFKALRRVSVG